MSPQPKTIKRTFTFPDRSIIELTERVDSYNGWTPLFSGCFSREEPATSVDRLRDGGSTWVACAVGVLYYPAPHLADRPTFTYANGDVHQLAAG